MVVVRAAATSASTVDPPAATEAAVESMASTSSAVEGPPETHAVANAFSDPSAWPNVVFDVVSKALASVGLGPFVSNNPLAPVDSPAMWAVLAWVRRQNQQTLIGETPAISKTPAQSSQTVDNVVTGNTGLSASVPVDVANAAAATPSVPGVVLFRDRFDTAAIGRLTKATGDAVFCPCVQAPGSYPNASIIDDGEGGKAVRNRIPANTLGETIVAPKLSRPSQHVVEEYDVRFSPNFDWRWGGKMGPGLVGVAPGHGIYEPTSGNPNRNVGFSVRLMWHGNGDDGRRPFQGTLGPLPAGFDNDIVTYVYALNPNGSQFNNFGFHERLNREAQPGQWHHIKTEVAMNTVGQANGVLKIWWDGALVVNHSNYRYRSTTGVNIQAILWDVHRGGGLSGSWTSKRDGYIDVRNVTVTEVPSIRV